MGQPSLPRLHLCGLLLFALLSPASCTCRVGKREECMEAPFVPGHDLVGEGFDIVKMARKRAYTMDVQTYMHDDGTCQLCENDKMDKELQKLPLSVVDWRSNAKTTRSLTSATYSTVTELVQSSASSIKNDWKLGLKIKDLGLDADVQFGKSVSAQFALQISKRDYYTYIVHEFNHTYYSFRASSQAGLSKEFSLEISQLPKEYNEKTKKQYKQFINTYGTHYLDNLDLGGRIKTMTAIRTCIAALKGHRINEIAKCLTGKLSLTFDLNLGTSNVEFCSSVFKDIDANVTSENTYFQQVTEISPGDVLFGIFSSIYNDSTGFKLWFERSKYDPGVVSYTLNPLPKLITDKVIQANVITAIQQYLKDNAVSSSGRLECKSGSCCPSELHKATLKINEISATNLDGDWWGRTEATAKLTFGGNTKSTYEIKSDNPTWYNIDFGTVYTITGNSLRVDVYDDDWWRLEHLGTCFVNLPAGSGTKTCYFRKSTVTVSYTLTCATQLNGDLCEKYTPR
ncbi:perforin-1-like [Engraulis encrasicolus]|uniref:perforin-1-like n=1 Tax=Engraulis encrasicolus TaxID=184585 RepID=UPI002FCFBF30